jgi:hypothetical protein
LRNHINKMKRDAERSPPDEDITAANATSTLSSLTLAGIGILNSNTVTGTASMGGGTSGGEDNIAGGRPKGSSAKSKRDLKQREQLAMLESARQYQKELKKKREQVGSSSARLKDGTLATIIEKAKALYNVENCTINFSTIRSRCKRNHINPVVSQGTVSPMVAVEPYLIAVILQLARMRSPINATMGLHLANSMIQGMDIEKAIIAMRGKRKKKLQASSSSTLTTAHSSTTSGSRAPAALNNAANNEQQQQQQQQEQPPAEGETIMLLHLKGEI